MSGWFFPINGIIGDTCQTWWMKTINWIILRKSQIINNSQNTKIIV